MPDPEVVAPEYRRVVAPAHSSADSTVADAKLRLWVGPLGKAPQDLSVNPRHCPQDGAGLHLSGISLRLDNLRDEEAVSDWLQARL